MEHIKKRSHIGDLFWVIDYLKRSGSDEGCTTIKQIHLENQHLFLEDIE